MQMMCRHHNYGMEKHKTKENKYDEKKMENECDTGYRKHVMTEIIVNCKN